MVPVGSWNRCSVDYWKGLAVLLAVLLSPRWNRVQPVLGPECRPQGVMQLQFFYLCEVRSACLVQ